MSYDSMSYDEFRELAATIPPPDPHRVTSIRFRDQHTADFAFAELPRADPDQHEQRAGSLTGLPVIVDDDVPPLVMRFVRADDTHDDHPLVNPDVFEIRADFDFSNWFNDELQDRPLFHALGVGRWRDTRRI